MTSQCKHGIIPQAGWDCADCAAERERVAIVEYLRKLTGGMPRGEISLVAEIIADAIECGAHYKDAQALLASAGADSIPPSIQPKETNE